MSLIGFPRVAEAQPIPSGLSYKVFACKGRFRFFVIYHRTRKRILRIEFASQWPYFDMGRHRL
jgi:hypothetical protein